jgi:hypothetical protein
VSNPAVVILSETKTDLGGFRVEDNIGEAIHLHLGEFRLDLTVNQFLRLADEIADAVQKYMEDIPGFDLRQISNEFFLQKADCWNDLIKVHKVKMNLSQLRVDTKGLIRKYVIRPLRYSRVIKAINGDNRENDKQEERNYFGQTNSDRIDSMLASIKEYGYPKDEKYIAVFNDQNIIADGQHRAACLLHLYGDIQVDILRFYFRNNKCKSHKNLLEKLFKWDKSKLQRIYCRIVKHYHRIKDLRNLILRIINRVYVHFLVGIDRRKYVKGSFS